MIRMFAAVVILLVSGGSSLFGAPPSLGVDVKVSPRANGHLFEIKLKDLANEATLASPRIVAQANQVAVAKTEIEAGKIKIYVETDGTSAQVTVEVIEENRVTSS